MQDPVDLQDALRGAGLRVTRPRLAVLDAVHAHPHATTDALIAAARERLGALSHQAVYDVLRVLTDCGLVRRIQPQGSVARYEARVGDNHHHQVCRACGAISDVDCRVGAAPCLVPRDATSTPADGHDGDDGDVAGPGDGFHVDEAEVTFWGLCAACARTAGRGHPPDRTTEFPDVPDPLPGRRIVTQTDGCPVHHGSSDPSTASTSESENPAIPSPSPAHEGRPRTVQDWWPNQVDLSPLNRPSKDSDPLGADFDYAAEVATLDVEAVKRDVAEVMHTSQEWWPADWGHYGPLFIRMSWHAAGTYRAADGRGGAGAGGQRFAPLNSWPDNANLDKARRLLLPVKQKYGRRLSWADLLVLAGNVAHDDMGLPTFGFAFGRADSWQPTEVFWGPEDTWLGDERYADDAPLDLDEGDLAAVTMGLIYVNPEGPQGRPDPLASAHDIRVTFGRMGMNDVETAALVAGGHTFGKAHGAGDPSLVGPEPEGTPVQGNGLGWANQHGTGKGADTTTSGLEGAWTPTPTQWDSSYLDMLYSYEWELTTSPAGAKQWTPKDRAADDLVPDAHVEGKRNAPMMLTSDLALMADPAFKEVMDSFRADQEYFADQYARAWFKLLHRDMGPRSRYLGPDVPSEELIWQDPVPAVDHDLLDDAQVADLKARLLASGLGAAQLVRTAWAAASSYRDTDKRGGANGARIRLEPQVSWAVNAGVADVLTVLERVRGEFQDATGARVSLADVIVLGGTAAVEKAARDGGVPVTVGFRAGRTDASQEQTDVENFRWLQPRADGFRNWVDPRSKLHPETLLVDKAYQLSLTAKEMTVLVGGLRVLGATAGGVPHGVFTQTPGVLTQDFFRTLLDLGVQWRTSAEAENVYEAVDADGAVVRTATAVDLVFNSSSILRGIAEVYSGDDAHELFVRDFAAAWQKVMELDRFDLR